MAFWIEYTHLELNSFDHALSDTQGLVTKLVCCHLTRCHMVASSHRFISLQILCQGPQVSFRSVSDGSGDPKYSLRMCWSADSDADLTARSSPAASTTTTSTASCTIAASSSTTASSFQPNSAPSAEPTAWVEHACLFGYQPSSGNPCSRPNNERRPSWTNCANLPYNRGQMWTRTFFCLASSTSS